MKVKNFISDLIEQGYNYDEISAFLRLTRRLKMENKNECPVCDFNITEDIHNNGYIDSRGQFWCWAHSDMDEEEKQFHLLGNPDLARYFEVSK